MTIREQTTAATFARLASELDEIRGEITSELAKGNDGYAAWLVRREQELAKGVAEARREWELSR